MKFYKKKEVLKSYIKYNYRKKNKTVFVKS